RQRPVAAANRDRPFLSEYADDSRSRYYKDGWSEAIPIDLLLYGEMMGIAALHPSYRQQKKAGVAAGFHLSLARSPRG
ncbi:hypothetical protein, partial [Bradyrhizobium sp. NAS96.2]|uniref:hypothetical protein n=1 Tax=Bradyrhizobium sp. NAS96.2 TaxID=1680160 RepID=UPI0009644FE1